MKRLGGYQFNSSFVKARLWKQVFTSQDDETREGTIIHGWLTLGGAVIPIALLHNGCAIFSLHPRVFETQISGPSSACHKSRLSTCASDHGVSMVSGFPETCLV